MGQGIQAKALRIVEDLVFVAIEDWEMAEKTLALYQVTAENRPRLSGIVLEAVGELALSQARQEAIAKAWIEQTNLPVIWQKGSQTVAELREKLQQRQNAFGWELSYEGFKTGKEEYCQESLLTVGNGFIGLRGTLPEMEISDEFYPATYLAGLYNQATSSVEGREVCNEDFVNAPNLQYFTLETESGERLQLDAEHVLACQRKIDFKTGLFQSRTHFRFADGKEVKVTFQRLVSMSERHHYVLRYAFQPVNFSGLLTVITKAEGQVYNYNVARYRSLTRQHLAIMETKFEAGEVTLVAKTQASQLTIVQRSRLLTDGLGLLDESASVTESAVHQRLTFAVVAGETYAVEKSVEVHLLQDGTEQVPKFSAPHFNAALAENKKCWQALWEQADIVVTGDMLSQKMLRLHTFHLLVSGAPCSNPHLDVSITARGLHGEAYRGHIFWDELFILPFYILHFPEVARSILMYRYRRIGAAKSAAIEKGYRGAMFPWQSGLSGAEESQELHLNPLNGQWDEDHSRLQRHVSLAIAYNVWLYVHTTGDEAFLKNYGSELLLEIAAFWQSAATYNPVTSRYDICHVMGPDEFHEAYPGAKTGGFTNNAYTNLMVVWLFEEIQKLEERLTVTELQTLLEKTQLTQQDLAEMRMIRQNLTLERNAQGVLAQFEGYFNLKELDFAAYREKYGNIYRMDRILRAEGKSADDYQVAKQADTLMAFYNLSQPKINQILAELGYVMPADYLQNNLDYYLARTSHGSTLSRIVHAKLAEMTENHELAWELYQAALFSDYRDIQGGTTAEGIHAGVMAATLYVTLTTYAGLDIREKTLSLQPKLPRNWDQLAFKCQIKTAELAVQIQPTLVTVVASENLSLKIGTQPFDILAGEKIEVAGEWQIHD